ncbi:MAG TPA: ABC transporter substrate-binding protein [Stellaceae bacterium]|nr:ABC transporter substrate-binding protein [Stellaceae bacterium]
MKWQMRNLIGGAVALVLLAGVVPSTAAAATDTWRHGVLDAKSDAGILLMVGQGFGKKDGLKIDVMQFHNDIVELQALLAGQLDSYEGGPDPAIVAAARGADVKIIGCQWPILPHGIMARDDIKSVADLKGKTIAISAPGGMPDLLARAVLAKYDIPVADVRFASLGNDGNRYKSVVAGVAQAAVVSREYVPIAKKQGVKLLVAGKEALPNYLRTCIMMTGKTIATRHADAVRFAAAEMRALRYSLSHRNAALALTRKLAKTPPTDPRPAYIYDWAVKDHAVDPTLALPHDKLAWMENQLVQLHKLPKPIDIDQVIDPSVREGAVKLAGK